MVPKPEIQYIGQFYVHGSEAKALETQPEEKKSDYKLPLYRFEKLQKIYVDPLAICSMVMAVVLMVCMVAGTILVQNAWQELETVNQYVYDLEAVHLQRVTEFRSSYDLEKVRTVAEAMGMVPVAEVQRMTIAVTMPEPKAEPTVWDDIVWFMEGLFA